MSGFINSVDIGYGKDIQVLTFRALALRQSDYVSTRISLR